MMSAKFATLDLLQIKIFLKKYYDVTFSICDFTNEILSYDSNYFVEVIMWPSLVILAFLGEKLS